MCVWLHRRKKKLAVPWESLPCTDVFVDYLASPGSVTNFSAGFGFCFVVAVGVSMNPGNVPASIGSSFAGHCRRGRSGRFRCGDHGAKSIACKASGTHRADSWSSWPSVVQGPNSPTFSLASYSSASSSIHMDLLCWLLASRWASCCGLCCVVQFSFQATFV